jgi:hypothetical protein
MKIQSIHDEAFRAYGFPVKGIDTTALIGALQAKTPRPDKGTVYVPSEAALEAVPAFAEFRDKVFGGIPIQFGYCNGQNTKLNCLEWHRGSEVLVAADDIVLMVARLQDIRDNKIDSAKVEAFLVKAGEAVLYYETTLHYAPARKEGPFRTVIILPRDTNTERPAGSEKLLQARNKWLLSHADAPEAANAVVGVTGANLDIA